MSLKIISRAFIKHDYTIIFVFWDRGVPRTGIYIREHRRLLTKVRNDRSLSTDLYRTVPHRTENGQPAGVTATDCSIRGHEPNVLIIPKKPENKVEN